MNELPNVFHSYTAAFLITRNCAKKILLDLKWGELDNLDQDLQDLTDAVKHLQFIKTECPDPWDQLQKARGDSVKP